MSPSRVGSQCRPKTRSVVGAALILTLGCTAAGSAEAARSVPVAHGSATPSRTRPHTLPLGPTGLPETRTTTIIEPGVTMTHILRGTFDPSTPWVVELSIPSSSTSPDPDAPPRAVQDQGSADELVRRLTAAGFDAQSQPVRQPAVADVPAGVIGYRVRTTSTFSSQADAAAYVTRLKAAGFAARTWYAGWDGASLAKGQWSINVLTIDPREFRGELGATFGPTSWTARPRRRSAPTPTPTPPSTAASSSSTPTQARPATPRGRCL